MPKPHTHWTVLPHGALTQLADNLWHVTGSLPRSPLPRAMTVARRPDGQLVLHNPIALEEPAMATLAGLGRVGQLVVPNRMHRMDCAAFKRRFPEAQVVCPTGGRDAIAQIVRVDATYDDMVEDDVVRFEHLDGERKAEGVMQVRSEDGLTLVFCDTLFNLPHQPGLAGLVVRALGSTGGPRVTRIAKLFLVRDRAALRDHLERLAQRPQLRRLVPGHGEVIDQDAADVLRAVARAL